MLSSQVVLQCSPRCGRGVQLEKHQSLSQPAVDTFIVFKTLQLQRHPIPFIPLESHSVLSPLLFLKPLLLTEAGAEFMDSPETEGCSVSRSIWALGQDGSDSDTARCSAGTSRRWGGTALTRCPSPGATSTSGVGSGLVVHRALTRTASAPYGSPSKPALVMGVIDRRQCRGTSPSN